LIETCNDCPDLNFGEAFYSELANTLSNPEKEDYEEVKNWVDKDWNPETFDKNAVKFYNPYQRWKKAFLEK
jgi:hypothetical protein